MQWKGDDEVANGLQPWKMERSKVDLEMEGGSSGAVMEMRYVEMVMDLMDDGDDVGLEMELPAVEMEVGDGLCRGPPLDDEILPRWSPV